MTQDAIKSLLATNNIEKTAEMLAQMPPQTKRIIYDEISAGHLGKGGKIATLRDMLVRDLNSRRYQHVQRLFIDSFQPFLISNLAFAYNSRTVKRVITRIDAFALWGLASDKLIPELAERAAPFFKRAAEKRLIEEVLASDKAQEIRHEMCRRCALALRSALKDSSRTEAMLENFNMHLRLELRQRHRGTPFHPRRKSVLDFAATLMEHNASLLPQLNRVLAPSPQMKRATSLIERMDDAFIALEDEYEEHQHNPMLMQLVPITTLHVLGNYKEVASFLEPVRRIWPLKESFRAYMDHIDVLGTAIRSKLLESVGGGHSWIRRVVISENDLNMLSTWVYQFVECLYAADRLGISHEEKLIGMLRSTLSMLTDEIKDPFLYIIRDRAIASSIDRNGAAEDHDHIVALLRLVWKIKLALDDFHSGAYRIIGVNLYLREEMQVAFLKALQQKSGDTTQQRLAHMSRICELLDAVECNLSKIVTTGHHGLIAMISELLDRSGTFTENEIRLVRNVAEKVDSELSLIQHWKDDILLAFSEKVHSQSHRLAFKDEAVSLTTAA